MQAPHTIITIVNISLTMVMIAWQNHINPPIIFAAKIDALGIGRNEYHAINKWVVVGESKGAYPATGIYALKVYYTTV